MQEKNFLGLDGLKHFWSKAKTWIINRITTEVTAKIAEIVAEAPEDLDTLKEIADWISTHADDAAAMNSAILANKTAISGKADKSHTHTKSQITDFPTSLKNPNALTINGNTYDGSTAVDAGVQTVANGGTGVTTQADINKAFIGDLEEGASDVTDGTEFVSSYASNNGFAETTEGAVNKPYRRKFSKVWNYIKGKADSIYATLSHTHTKSQITDFPTSLPANGGTATAVSDCGHTAITVRTIKIGYAGEDLTSCRYLAAYNHDGSQIRTIPTSAVSVGNADTATYAASAGSANSVAWGNVTGKPAYITGSYSNGILNLYTN